jgi:hypothetical protein
LIFKFKIQALFGCIYRSRSKKPHLLKPGKPALPYLSSGG